MAYTYLTSVTYKATGEQTNFAIPFDYLRAAFVYVDVDGVNLTSGFEVNNRVLVFAEAPAEGSLIKIYRQTPTKRLVSWADASILKARDMEIARVQELHILEEQQDKANVVLSTANDALADSKLTLDEAKEIKEAAATSATNAIAANKEAQQANAEVKQIYNNGMLTPISDLAGSIGTELKRWGTIFANKVFASNLPLMYNSVSDMKSDKKLKAGMTACTLGYYEPNDGGAGTYIIRAKQDGDVDDGGSLHELANGNVAELVVENGTVCPEQFGAKGDGVSDDTEAMQKCLMTPYNLVGYKSYKILSDIYITNSKSINNCHFVGIFDNNILKRLVINADNVVIQKNTFDYFELYLKNGNNITINKNNYTNFGIGIGSLENNGSFNNLLINGNTLLHQLPSTSANAEKWQILGAIAFEHCNLKSVRIVNNIIDMTNSFGIIFYYNTMFDDVIVENNTISHTGANRLEESTTYSGCGGIYKAGNGYKGIICNNVLKHINEVGIEGSYFKVTNNYIEDTGCYSYNKNIDDQHAIYGRSVEIANNYILNPGNGSGIFLYQDEISDTPSNIQIMNNTLICNYKYWQNNTIYTRDDYVRYEGKIYRCTQGGTSDTEFIPNDTTEFADGSCTWIYYKKYNKNACIHVQNEYGCKVIGNIIDGFYFGINVATRSLLIKNNSIINCDKIFNIYNYVTVGTYSEDISDIVFFNPIEILNIDYMNNDKTILCKGAIVTKDDMTVLDIHAQEIVYSNILAKEKRLHKKIAVVTLNYKYESTDDANITFYITKNGQWIIKLPTVNDTFFEMKVAIEIDSLDELALLAKTDDNSHIYIQKISVKIFDSY